MPFIDQIAAAQIRDLRETAGLSQEGLARALRLKAEREGWYHERGAVDAFTIRAIEQLDHLPSLRVQMALSLFFGVDRRAIWRPENRQMAGLSLRQRMDARRDALRRQAQAREDSIEAEVARRVTERSGATG